MKRYVGIGVALIGVVAVGLSFWVWRQGGQRDLPNVVLISVDTVRADHLGCYGYFRPVSPAIDKFASGAVRFENAFTQASWTLPSHMTVMTSQYPSVHCVIDRGLSLPDQATMLAEVLSEEGYHTAAFVTWIYVGEAFGFDQGFDEFHELIDRSGQRVLSGRGAFSAERTTDAVIARLEETLPQPFFLFVHYFDPHMHYTPPPPYDTLFDPDYTGEACGERGWLQPYIKTLQIDPAVIDPRDRAHVEALYDGELCYTDAHLGRLFEAIDTQVELDSCMVVFMSDHGEEFNDHGSMEGHGWTLYDEIIHVPLIFRMPGPGRPGTVIEDLVGLIDIGPTILQALGVAAPASFQGRSLTGLIDGSAAA